MKYLLHFLLLVLITPLCKAQNSFEKCGLDHKMEAIYKENPEYKDLLEKGYEDFNRGLIGAKKRISALIPVHIIIVHPPGQPIGTGDNLTMDRILSQIVVLNEDFTRTNPDAGNTPAQFPAGNPAIEFCLATVDANGNATNGVTRYATSMDFENNESTIKSATGWPRANYLNIWVAQLSSGLLGFAYLPTTGGLPNATLDGVVSGTPYFGGPGQATGSPYDLGRTVTHEVGHFLGLRHIWRNSGCGLDDGINDTPLQDDENFGCPNHPSPSCGNSGDMFMNYMDYVNDNCMNAFSVEQGDYMNTILNTSRSSLANSGGFACAAANPLTFEIVDSGDPSCYLGFDGFINVEATGGTGNYTYTLNNGTSNNTGIFTNLQAGPYDITVEDGNETLIISITLTEPVLLEIFEGLVEDNTCFSGKTGSIEVFGNGGSSATGNYQYQLNSNLPQSTGIFTDLVNNTYTLTVIDDNDCTAQLTVFITSPPKIIINFLDTTAIKCNGDSLGGFKVSGSGGVPTYKYSIGGNYQTSGVFNNLPAGIYSVSLKDNNDCIETKPLTLIQPQLLVSMVDSLSNVSCNGGNNGYIEMLSQGGTPGYQYITGMDTSSSAFTNLYKGTYMIRTVDTNSCETLDTVIINEPAKLVGQIDSTSPPVCVGDATGFINLSAIGGIAPYSFKIGNHTNTTGSFVNLVPGNYTCDITDANGCIIQVNATVAQNPLINASIIKVSPLCKGNSNGIITINASGGTGTLQYSINNAPFSSTFQFLNLKEDNYLLKTKDALGCEVAENVFLDDPDALTYSLNLSIDPCGLSTLWEAEAIVIGGTSPFTFDLDGTIVNSSNGLPVTYAGMGDFTGLILMNDANGCAIDIPLNIILVSPMEVIASGITPASCDGSILGSVQLNATNGTLPLTFKFGQITNSTGFFDNLPAGKHQFTITDTNGCILNKNVSIPTDANGFEINEILFTSISCFGENDGTVTISIFGGTGPFTYTLNEVSNSSGEFTNLMPGFYEVKVFDEGNDCLLTSELEIIEPKVLSGKTNIIHGSYEGENKIEITAKDGSPPYQFGLDNIDVLQESNVFERLSTGTHTIYIIDKNGCEYSESIGLTAANEIIENDKIKIYPNPINDYFNVEINVDKSTSFDLTILDLSGKIVHISTNILFSKSKYIQTFYVKEMQNSIYIVKIASGNEIMYRKVFVR